MEVLRLHDALKYLHILKPINSIISYDPIIRDLYSYYALKRGSFMVKYNIYSQL